MCQIYLALTTNLFSMLNFTVKTIILSGIYIHIPFCKQACHYCDFHFSTNQIQLEKMVDSILKEIESRKHYLGSTAIETIYYGGGTPSLLAEKHIKQIQDSIYHHFKVVDDVEVTLECNPDDLLESYLKSLKKVGVNRLSIGVQSFDEDQLKKLNRAHNATEAKNAIRLAHKLGFHNITIDLMYGLPGTDIEYWTNQISEVLSLKIKHISAYCLTFEEKTAFGKWLKTGKILPLNDEKNLDQFKLLVQSLKNEGFEHYEISNFSLDGYISKHNSAYWLGNTYMGVGPSAHSFDGLSRQWNLANNPRYIKNVSENVKHYEEEVLTKKDHYNEYILTRLRTKWGLEKEYLESSFHDYLKISRPVFSKFIDSGDIIETRTHFYITEKGKFIADHITSDLFVI